MGTAVGVTVGSKEVTMPLKEGNCEGESKIALVGSYVVVIKVGDADGATDDTADGTNVGIYVGTCDKVGILVGIKDGFAVGL